MLRNLIYFLSVCFLASCVPAQKFKETESKMNNYKSELDLTKQNLEQLSVENTEMKQKLGKTETQLNSLIKDSMARSGEMDRISKDLDNKKYQLSELQETQESILKGNAKETAKLLKQLQTTQEDLKKKEEALNLTEKNLEEKRRNLENLTLELNKRDARLNELEGILFRKDSVVNNLKQKVSDALLGFEKDDLTVKVQNGKVYVSMEDKLMFKSASASIDAKGQEALKKLAKILEQNPDINITIEGHTDNVPFKSDSKTEDNWDLSVQRSTEIIRLILRSSKIDPHRLIAAGRGEYAPITNNKTSEARSKNRRTEIILTPKLDELFKILESN
jgi:chemotaxis protein MotB